MPNLALPVVQSNDTHGISRLQEYDSTNTLRTHAHTRNRLATSQVFRIFASQTPNHMNDTAEWAYPAERSVLSRDMIHVWRASLEIEPATLQRLKSTLAKNELERAERFIFDQDRNRFIAARGILRNVLARYLQCAPQTIEFVYGARGKPAISSGSTRDPLRFNLSHSHGLALIGLAREHEIGIDLEMIRSDFASEEIAKRYFSAKEIDELRGLPADLRTEGFFLCWTRKEAYIKAKGDGLHIPLDSFDVSLTPGLPPELNCSDRSRWSMISLTPESGYVAAVVEEGNGSQLCHFNWAP
jgi:4'-phosphopantetheinyl transferase